MILHMPKNRFLLPLIITVIIFTASFTEGTTDFNPSNGLQIDTLAENLRVPWQIAFLPDKSILFTEREGRVRLFTKGKLMAKPILNLNDVILSNKSGALGLCIHPLFSKNRQVYLASNYNLEGRMKLRIVRYELIGDTLANAKTILRDIPANQNHTGCRLVFGPDSKLYITTGDADEPMKAQSLSDYNGKILRVNDDGSIPQDNPFVNTKGACGEIWSFGHRNPQGLAFQPGTGLLYETEHGPTGGDEINIITKGGNYGWPIAHHDLEQPQMISPIRQYTPSIGPGEAMFYTGKAFPELTNKLLIACLRDESIRVIDTKSGQITSDRLLIKGTYGRIRSLVPGPDGYIFFSTSMHDPGEGHPRDYHDDMIVKINQKGKLMLIQEVATKWEKSDRDRSVSGLFRQLCASCHGERLQGTATAKDLIGNNFRYGSDKKSIVNSISKGIVSRGMPAWDGALSKQEVSSLADFIISKRKM